MQHKGKGVLTTKKSSFHPLPLVYQKRFLDCEERLAKNLLTHIWKLSQNVLFPNSYLISTRILYWFQRNSQMPWIFASLLEAFVHDWRDSQPRRMCSVTCISRNDAGEQTKTMTFQCTIRDAGIFQCFCIYFH